MNHLTPGEFAPDFTLLDTEGNSVTLSALRGQRVILYFYPRDNTPGCTKEACGFRDHYADFQAVNTLILGISMDDAKSHAKFTQRHQLPFPLLCDTDAGVAAAYGSYGLKKFMGKEYMGVMRHTIVIDASGRIERIYRKVKPEPHAKEILTDLQMNHSS